MDPKQDYFRSPTPRNLENFYSPFRLLRPDQDPLLINNSLSPLNRNARSYISQLSPSQNSFQHSQLINKPKFQLTQANKIKEVLSFGDQQEEQQLQQSEKLSTPEKNKIKIQQIQTTSKKKYELRIIQSNARHHTTRDAQKGLRALSKQAYDVFQTANYLTYQQVAQRIILENQQLSEYPDRKRQRQSIKRRVYDALNVLIAVGKLEKIGKKILLSRKMKKQNEKQVGAIKKLSEKYQDKKQIVQSKKKNLQLLKMRMNILRSLMLRNKDRSPHPSEKINFPFVIAKQKCKLTSVNQAKIAGFFCGDIDSLRFLDFTTK